MQQRAAYTLIAAGSALCLLEPTLAHAAVAGGGGMPYSNGLNTFKTSITGEIAAIIAVIGVVAGVAAYLYQGVLDPLLMKIVQVVIAVCIIGGVTTFLTTMGVTGAVVIDDSLPTEPFLLTFMLASLAWYSRRRALLNAKLWRRRLRLAVA